MTVNGDSCVPPYIDDHSHDRSASLMDCPQCGHNVQMMGLTWMHDAEGARVTRMPFRDDSA